VYEIGGMPNSKFEFCNCTSLIVTSRTIISTSTEKNWKLSFVKLIHKRTNVCGSATKCKTGSGRPKTARTVEACMELRMLFVVCNNDFTMHVLQLLQYLFYVFY